VKPDLSLRDKYIQVLTYTEKGHIYIYITINGITGADGLQNSEAGVASNMKFSTAISNMRELG
jgi:hypothetical protein